MDLASNHHCFRHRGWFAGFNEYPPSSPAFAQFMVSSGVPWHDISALIPYQRQPDQMDIGHRAQFGYRDFSGGIYALYWALVTELGFGSINSHKPRGCAAPQKLDAKIGPFWRFASTKVSLECSENGG